DYVEWAAANNFVSMLPNDTKQQRANATLSMQPSLDKHLICKEPVVKYTDSSFSDLAVHWLIDMDQPVHALQHPSFQAMINLVSRATNGITIPTRKDTQQKVINLFRRQLLDLHKHLTVGFQALQMTRID
ncbi:hypothetical protein EV363DRAFT_1159309, partial [Boletus edulis]